MTNSNFQVTYSVKKTNLELEFFEFLKLKKKDGTMSFPTDLCDTTGRPLDVCEYTAKLLGMTDQETTSLQDALHAVASLTYEHWIAFKASSDRSAIASDIWDSARHALIEGARRTPEISNWPVIEQCIEIFGDMAPTILANSVLSWLGSLEHRELTPLTLYALKRRSFASPHQCPEEDGVSETETPHSPVPQTERKEPHPVITLFAQHASVETMQEILCNLLPEDKELREGMTESLLRVYNALQACSEEEWHQFIENGVLPSEDLYEPMCQAIELIQEHVFIPFIVSAYSHADITSFLPELFSPTGEVATNQASYLCLCFTVLADRMRISPQDILELEDSIRPF